MDKEEIKKLLENCHQQITNIQILIKEILEIDFNIKNLEEFCKSKSIEFNDYIFNQPDTQNCINDIKTVSFEVIDQILLSYKNKVQYLIKNFNDWENYNEQYKNYIFTSTNKFINQIAICFNIKTGINFKTFFYSINNGFKLLTSNLNSSIDSLFEKFKYGSKNYVIFGKNGAGKTTLLNKIVSSVLKDNSFVIPANRSLFMQDESSSFYYNPKIELNKIFKETNSLQYMAMRISTISLDEMLQNSNIDNNLIKKLERIFNSLDLERKILIKDYYIYLYESNISEKYTLPECSDGEKAVIYLINSILLLPPNAFVFIDEPELHLNGALMQKLFNTLENERKDIKFIYVTHIINFVESRKNVELIYLEKTNKHETWKFKNIADFESTDIDMILGIEGTQDDIIFCEGNNQNSIDHKILDCIFDDCFIKPVGSCELAINNTKLLHSTGKYNFLKRKAYAIIDNDFRTDMEIEKLKTDMITVLNYNEWENLLLSDDVITYVNNKTLKHNIIEIKEKIIILINSGKAATMNDFLNKRYVKILIENKLSYKNFQDALNKTNTKNQKLITQESEAYEKLFNKYISEKDYENLIKIVPAKRVFKESSKLLGFSDYKSYLDRIVVLVKEDSEFKDMLKNKIGLIR